MTTRKPSYMNQSNVYGQHYDASPLLQLRNQGDSHPPPLYPSEYSTRGALSPTSFAGGSFAEYGVGQKVYICGYPFAAVIKLFICTTDSQDAPQTAKPHYP